MIPLRRAVEAASDARDLCLSLRRAAAGSRALAATRAGEGARLPPDELTLALGLAWAAGDLALVRRALRDLPPGRVERDAVLLAFRDGVAGRATG